MWTFLTFSPTPSSKTVRSTFCLLALNFRIKLFQCFTQIPTYTDTVVIFIFTPNRSILWRHSGPTSLTIESMAFPTLEILILRRGGKIKGSFWGLKEVSLDFALGFLMHWGTGTRVEIWTVCRWESIDHRFLKGMSWRRRDWYFNRNRPWILFNFFRFRRKIRNDIVSQILFRWLFRLLFLLIVKWSHFSISILAFDLYLVGIPILI